MATAAETKATPRRRLTSGWSGRKNRATQPLLGCSGPREPELKMKQLKSSLRDLREILERSFTVRQISEPLASFDASTPIEGVRSFMEKKDYDVVGVRDQGLIVGHARRSDVGARTLAECSSPFDPSALIPDSAPLRDALRVLVDAPYLFVLVLDRVWGIVTRGDLQKVPVRMWLFALISLMEMRFLRLIRECYPENSWTSQLSSERVGEAQRLLALRVQRNEAIDLADCLQLCDKRAIIAKTEILRGPLGFASRTKADDALEPLEKLRDNLAHAQDLKPGNWAELMELAARAEDVVARCETLSPGPVTAP